ncbi:MAG: HD domain-containing protein [Bacteroidaceae bacterium]|nr:HD domain-containing protein [Bacteroidaceae bacterium]
MTLQEYIAQHIIPRYEAFDKAHNLTHVTDVIERSMTLAKQYGVDADMAYTIAAYHDLGLCEGRERHHIVSGEIVTNDSMLPQWFTPEQVTIIKEAVEDHRASNNQAPRSIYGCIVAEADRLIDPDTTLRRTVQYGLKHLDTDNREVHYERFCNHLQEKYAEGGYLRLWLPQSDNKVRLDELRAIIANHEELRRRFDQIFDEEV